MSDGEISYRDRSVRQHPSVCVSIERWQHYISSHRCMSNVDRSERSHGRTRSYAPNEIPMSNGHMQCDICMYRLQLVLVSLAAPGLEVDAANVEPEVKFPGTYKMSSDSRS